MYQDKKLRENALRLDAFVVSHVTAGERDAFRMFMQNASAFEPWEIPLGNMVVRSKGLDCPDGCLGISTTCARKRSRS